MPLLNIHFSPIVNHSILVEQDSLLPTIFPSLEAIRHTSLSRLVQHIAHSAFVHTTVTMQLLSTLVGASMLLASSVTALGTARVVNNCNMPVYFASVSQSGADRRVLLPPSGYTEVYSKPNVGVSIKFSEALTGPVTQFEFTWAGSNVFYDISHIDGNPFWAQGSRITPSTPDLSAFPSCKVVDCPAGQQHCDAAYNLPDDVRTMVCPDTTDITFTLCTGGAASTSSKRETEQVATSASQPPTAVSSAQLASSGPHNHNRVHARHILKR